MKRTILTIIPLIFLTFSSYSLSYSSSDTPVTKEQKTVIFQGIVKKLDGGTALFTKETIYPLTGGDFQTIVGKEVFIVGTIVTVGDLKKIQVKRIQFDKN